MAVRISWLASSMAHQADGIDMYVVPVSRFGGHRGRTKSSLVCLTPDPWLQEFTCVYADCTCDSVEIGQECFCGEL